MIVGSWREKLVMAPGAGSHRGSLVHISQNDEGAPIRPAGPSVA